MENDFLDQVPVKKWNELVQLGNRFSTSNTGLTIISQDFSSSNYKAGVSGWTINSNGDVEFGSGTFRGTITSTAGFIGGFEIGTDYIRDVANTFGLSSNATASADDTRFWAGATYLNRALAALRVDEAGNMTINQASGTNRVIASRTGGVERWQLIMGDSTAESGSDVGTNFKIKGFSDSNPANFFIPIMLERKTGNVVISAFGGTLPHAASILEVQSTTKGVRFPNMTTTQRDAITPGAGTVIYNTTTAKLNVYTTAWEAITSA